MALFESDPSLDLLFWLFKGGTDRAPLKGEIDIHVEVDIDTDSYLGTWIMKF